MDCPFLSYLTTVGYILKYRLQICLNLFKWSQHLFKVMMEIQLQD